MAKRGRPRKAGPRDKKGKLRPVQMRDHGNDKTSVKHELFGSDGADAIGRAYRMGLLGEEGQSLVSKARTIKKVRMATTEAQTKFNMRCALNQGGGGVMSIDLDPDGQLARERRMFDALSCGRKTQMRSLAFDGLVIGDYSDSGPAWLDRLLIWEFEKIEAKRQGREPRESCKPYRMDEELLKEGIEALKAA